MDIWYYMKNGAEHGPVPTEAIRRALAAGELTRDTLVWREGDIGWVAIRGWSVFEDPPAPEATGPGKR